MLQRLKDALESSNRKVLIVEIGAACPISHGLMQCEGASKVVYHAESPYGSGHIIYSDLVKSHRMVSREVVRNITQYHINLSIQNQLEYNTVIVTSFQIKSSSEDKKVPHGWVGIGSILDGKESIQTYHLTLSDSSGNYYNRINSIEMIGEEVSRLFNSEPVEFIDIGNTETIFNGKSTVLFHEGEFCRIEEVCRKYQRIVLYKGSFNPLHKAHLELSRKMQREGTLVLLGISRNTYSKGRVSDVDLKNRCLEINEVGLSTVVFEQGYFYDSVEILKNRSGLPVDVVMGVDTFNRLIQCYDNKDYSPLEAQRIDSILKINSDIEVDKSSIFNTVFGDSIFYVFGRNQELYTSDIKANVIFDVTYSNPISSSQIRELEASGHSDKANSMKASMK